MAEKKEARSTVTKADIVEQVYEKIGFSKKEASELVEMVFDELKEALAKGQKVKISGFGNFIVKEKNPRAGRNPKTGEPMTITARKRLSFHTSQVLKGLLRVDDDAGSTGSDDGMA